MKVNYVARTPAELLWMKCGDSETITAADMRSALRARAAENAPAGRAPLAGPWSAPERTRARAGARMARSGQSTPSPGSSDGGVGGTMGATEVCRAACHRAGKADRPRV